MSRQPLGVRTRALGHQLPVPDGLPGPLGQHERLGHQAVQDVEHSSGGEVAARRRPPRPRRARTRRRTRRRADHSSRSGSSTGRSSSRSARAASAGAAAPCGAAGEQPEAVVEAVARSARPTASAPAPRPARWRAACRRAGGRSRATAARCPSVEREARRRRPRRARRRAAPPRARAPPAASCARIGQRERRDDVDRSPATPSGSRLVARRAAPAQPRSSVVDQLRRSRRQQVLAVVEDEQQLPVAQCVDAASRASGRRLSPTPSAAATARARAGVGRAAASSTSHTPSRNACRSRRGAASSASRVLPTPPGPVRVTSRESAEQPPRLGELALAPDEAGQGGMDRGVLPELDRAIDLDSWTNRRRSRADGGGTPATGPNVTQNVHG